MISGARTRHTPFGSSTKSREVRVRSSNRSRMKASTAGRTDSIARARTISIALVGMEHAERRVEPDCEEREARLRFEQGVKVVEKRIDRDWSRREARRLEPMRVSRSAPNAPAFERGHDRAGAAGPCARRSNRSRQLAPRKCVRPQSSRHVSALRAIHRKPRRSFTRRRTRLARCPSSFSAMR